jgi:hypothetical protein
MYISKDLTLESYSTMRVSNTFLYGRFFFGQSLSGNLLYGHFLCSCKIYTVIFYTVKIYAGQNLDRSKFLLVKIYVGKIYVLHNGSQQSVNLSSGSVACSVYQPNI